MNHPEGFINDNEQSKIEICLAEISQHKPYYSSTEKILLTTCWKYKDERNMTTYEASEIYRIHARINDKK